MTNRLKHNLSGIAAWLDIFALGYSIGENTIDTVLGRFSEFYREYKRSLPCLIGVQKVFFTGHVERSAPIAVGLPDKRRNSAHSYYEFYRKAITVFMYEYDLSRLSCRQDKRLQGIILFFHYAGLFREYMDKSFPLFQWKQLKSGTFLPLIEGYVPTGKKW